MSVWLVVQAFLTFLNGWEFIFATRIVYGVQLTIKQIFKNTFEVLIFVMGSPID